MNLWLEEGMEICCGNLLMEIFQVCGVTRKFSACWTTSTIFGMRGGQRGAYFPLNMVTKLPNTNTNSKQALPLIFHPTRHCFVLNFVFYSNKLFKNSLDCSLCLKVMR